MNSEQLAQTLAGIRAEVGKVIIGNDDVIQMALITICTGNHALIEGVPGVAKTLLVRTLGRVLGCDAQRIQFTPDLMPADITGTGIFNMQTQTFDLVEGPVFTTFLLADEINRAPAKTQSALLQAMQERCVTIDRNTHRLSPAFTVFATQNPIEYEGTYPLPEAQKDRFLFKIPMDTPDREQEVSLARRTCGSDAPERLLESGAVQAVISQKELLALRSAFDTVTFRDELVGYVVDIVRATRRHGAVLVGAGPRATQGLIASCRVCAAFEDRDYVTPDDVKQMALPVLGHRIILRPEFEIEGLSVKEVVEEILREIAVPR